MRIDRARVKRRPIGLTSLIDVIFLLLLFFMLASTFQRYQALPLSGGGQSAAAAPVSRPALLRVHGGGRMDLNARPVQVADLARHLARLKESGIARVAVLSDDTANVQDVVSAVDAVEAARLTSILVAGN